MEPPPEPDPDFFTPRGRITIADPGWHRVAPNAERLIARALALTDCPADVILTNDRTVKRLNNRDRGRNKPTNVLTYDFPPEIILALGTVLREARAARRRPAHHLTHLVIHGALHLDGYDHDHAGDAIRMERRESRLLARLKIANPWKSLS